MTESHISGNMYNELFSEGSEEKCVPFLSMAWSRSSHWRYSMKKAVLKNFAVFKGKHLCWSLFLLKTPFIKKRHSNTCVFP